MAQFVGPTRAPLGPVQGCPEVKNAVLATTTVERLSDSLNRTQKIAGILPRRGGVQEEEEAIAEQYARTPMYLVDAPRANSDLFWSLTRRVLQQLRNVLIPNNVHELCDRCFYKCESLRRVNFGSSSLLERIGDSCFKGSGVEEVSIPDRLRELCKGCFPAANEVGETNTPTI